MGPSCVDIPMLCLLYLLPTPRNSERWKLVLIDNNNNSDDNFFGKHEVTILRRDEINIVGFNSIELRWDTGTYFYWEERNIKGKKANLSILALIENTPQQRPEIYLWHLGRTVEASTKNKHVIYLYILYYISFYYVYRVQTKVRWSRREKQLLVFHMTGALVTNFNCIKRTDI